MALLPSLFLIAGSITLAATPPRWRRGVLLGVATVTAGAALMLTTGISSEATVTLWRPTDLFGSGFSFVLDTTTWALILLAAATVLADAILDRQPPALLLYAAVAFAAITSGNLLTTAISWALMIGLEGALRYRSSNDIQAALRAVPEQVTAVVAVLASTVSGSMAGPTLGLAVVLRSRGGTDRVPPLSLAMLAPIAALSALRHFDAPSGALLWIGGAAIALALFRDILIEDRSPKSQDHRNLALAIAGAVVIVLGADAKVSPALVAGSAVFLVTQALHAASARQWVTITSLGAWIIAFAAVSAPNPLLGGVLAMVSSGAVALIAGASGAILVGRTIRAALVTTLAAASILGLYASGWILSPAGAVAGGLGIAAGYTLSRSRLQLKNIARQLVSRTTVGRGTTLKIHGGLSLSIRTLTEVLEGESAVLWILLTLLVIIVGVAA